MNVCRGKATQAGGWQRRPDQRCMSQGGANGFFTPVEPKPPYLCPQQTGGPGLRATTITLVAVLAATQAQAQSVYIMECRISSGRIQFIMDDRTGRAVLSATPGALQIPGRFRVTGHVLRFMAPGASAAVDNRRRAAGTLTISGRTQLM